MAEELVAGEGHNRMLNSGISRRGDKRYGASGGGVSAAPCLLLRERGSSSCFTRRRTSKHSSTQVPKQVAG